MSFSRVLTTFALAACAVQPVFAHMEMKFPAPLRSQNNPQYAGKTVDFDYTSPLSNDGSNFPCKGYADDVPSVSTAVATLEAGKQFTTQIVGGAPHGGGSCQFSLSYDKGRSWAVLHSVVGGCPLAGNYSFTVPQGIPSASNVLFSWSWFNKVGNREMYQNCAAVDVQGGSAPLQLPKMFEANIFGDGSCKTIEGTEVDFANPSGSVTNCPAGKLVTPDQKVTLSPSGSPAGGENQQQQQPSSTESPSSTSTSSTPANTGAPDDQSAGDDEEPCPPETDDQDDDGEEEEDCTEEGEDQDGTGNQQNGDGAPTVDDGDSEEEEASDNGDATPPPATPSSSAPSTPEPSSQPETSGGGSSGACTPGAMLCTDGGQSWSMCAYGKWVPMGTVAPGTKCVNGQHVPATRRASSRIYGRSGLAPQY